MIDCVKFHETKPTDLKSLSRSLSIPRSFRVSSFADAADLNQIRPKTVYYDDEQPPMTPAVVAGPLADTKLQVEEASYGRQL